MSELIAERTGSKPGTTGGIYKLNRGSTTCPTS